MGMAAIWLVRRMTRGPGVGEVAMEVPVVQGGGEGVQAVGGEAIDQGGGSGVAVAFAADEGTSANSPSSKRGT
jgi:hypothetical protein